MENNCATIILNWNGSNDTIACIESMNKLQEARTDLVIVDNASSPEEYKILEDYFESFCIVCRNPSDEDGK